MTTTSEPVPIDGPATVSTSEPPLPDACFYEGQWHDVYVYSETYTDTGTTRYNLSPCLPADVVDPVATVGTPPPPPVTLPATATDITPLVLVAMAMGAIGFMLERWSRR